MAPRKKSDAEKFAHRYATEWPKLPNRVTIPASNVSLELLENDGRRFLLQYSEKSKVQFHLFFVRRQFFPLNIHDGLTIPNYIYPGSDPGLAGQGPHVLVAVAFPWNKSSSTFYSAEEEARKHFGQDFTTFTISSIVGGHIGHVFRPRKGPPIPALVRYIRQFRKGKEDVLAHYDVLDQLHRLPRFAPFQKASDDQRPALDQYVQETRQEFLKNPPPAPPALDPRPPQPAPHRLPRIEVPAVDPPPTKTPPTKTPTTKTPTTRTPTTKTPTTITPVAKPIPTPGQDGTSDRLVRPHDATRDPRQAQSNEAASVPPPEGDDIAPNQTANDPPTTGEPVKDPLAMLVEESEIPEDLVDDTADAPTLGAPPPEGDDNAPEMNRKLSDEVDNVSGRPTKKMRANEPDAPGRSDQPKTGEPIKDIIAIALEENEIGADPTESPPDTPQPKVQLKPKLPPKRAAPQPAYTTMPSLDQFFEKPKIPPPATDALNTPTDSPGKESRSRTVTQSSLTQQVTRPTVAEPAASNAPARTTIEIAPGSDEEDEPPQPSSFVELYSKSPAGESSSSPESHHSLSLGELDPNLRSPAAGPSYLESSPDPGSPAYSLSSGELSPNLKSDGSDADQNVRPRRRDYFSGMDSDHSYSLAMETDPFQDLTSELDQTGFSLPPLNVPQYQVDDHGYHQVGVPTIEAEGPVDIVEGQPPTTISATDQEFVDELMNDIDDKNEETEPPGPDDGTQRPAWKPA